jgi:hypothetical protein
VSSRRSGWSRWPTCRQPSACASRFTSVRVDGRDVERALVIATVSSAGSVTRSKRGRATRSRPSGREPSAALRFGGGALGFNCCVAESRGTGRDGGGEAIVFAYRTALVHGDAVEVAALTSVRIYEPGATLALHPSGRRRIARSGQTRL